MSNKEQTYNHYVYEPTQTDVQQFDTVPGQECVFTANNVPGSTHSDVDVYLSVGKGELAVLTDVESEPQLKHEYEFVAKDTVVEFYTVVPRQSSLHVAMTCQDAPVVTTVPPTTAAPTTVPPVTEAPTTVTTEIPPTTVEQSVTVPEPVITAAPVVEQEIEAVEESATVVEVPAYSEDILPVTGAEDIYWFIGSVTLFVGVFATLCKKAFFDKVAG